MTDNAENAQTASAMNVLGIDTSTALAGIALQFDGVRRSETWRSDHNHGVELMPRILAMMSASGCTPKDLDRIAVALGPGGFSAVRVGVSCAQGLAAPLAGRVETIGVPTHYLQARCWADCTATERTVSRGGRIAPHSADAGATGSELSSTVTSVIPIGRDQVSWAQFRLPLGDISTGERIGIWSREEMASVATAGDTVLCGEGLVAIADAQLSGPGDSQIRAPETLIEIANEVPGAGSGATSGPDGLPLHPLYARAPTITRRT